MSADLFRLDGKVAWVTGGTKGLGLEMVNALAGAGADIVLNSRHPQQAADVAKEVADQHGVKTLGLGGDVVNPEHMRQVVDEATNQLGGIDILVNNAGVNVRQPTLELPLDEWQRVIDINLTGPFLCSQLVARQMVEKGWGRIIHISSILGHVGLAGRPPYTASKGGLILLTKTQALEFAGSGVTVNALCPGPFATEMNRPLLEDPEKYQEFIKKIPMGRWGELSEVHGPIVFLASPSSSFITGSTLMLDGGWTAW